MRALLLLGALVFTTGCALRALPPPIVQSWRAVLVDRSGFAILHRATVHEIYPFITWTTPCAGVSVLTIADGPCNGISKHARTFKLVTLDEASRTVLYQEVR